MSEPLSVDQIVDQLARLQLAPSMARAMLEQHLASARAEIAPDAQQRRAELKAYATSAMAGLIARDGASRMAGGAAAAARGAGMSAALAGLGLIAAGAIWRGLCLSLMWAWFIVPISGLRAISIAEAIGLSLVLQMLRGGSLSDEERRLPLSALLARSISGIFVFPLVGLALGAIVRLWLP